MNPYNIDEQRVLVNDRIAAALDFVERRRLAREFRGEDPAPRRGPMRRLVLAGAVAASALVVAVLNSGVAQ